MADDSLIPELPDSHPTLQRLTSQEVQFVTLIVRGLTPVAAGKQVGLNAAKAKEMVEQTNVRTALAAARDRVEQHIGFAVTRDNLTLMLLEAHSKSSSATEEIMAIRELGKMHGLYEPEKRVVEHQKITRVDQLRTFSDAELARLASLNLDSIDAEEAIFTEMPA